MSFGGDATFYPLKNQMTSKCHAVWYHSVLLCSRIQCKCLGSLEMFIVACTQIQDTRSQIQQRCLFLCFTVGTMSWDFIAHCTQGQDRPWMVKQVKHNRFNIYVGIYQSLEIGVCYIFLFNPKNSNINFLMKKFATCTSHLLRQTEQSSDVRFNAPRKNEWMGINMGH